MLCKYILTQDQTSTCTTYGICAVNGGYIVEEARDISQDKQKVEHLVDLCNRLGLSSVHLHDVVEDVL